VKRSKDVRRLLLGGLTAGALTTCVAAATAPRVTTESYFTNDDHIPGAGFYHAPFRAFYAHPYNFYDQTRKQYYYGGQWGPAPYRSIVNISAPTAEAARSAESLRTDLRQSSGTVFPRSGFGSTSNTHTIRS
jgi:hypothetical protein